MPDFTSIPLMRWVQMTGLFHRGRTEAMAAPQGFQPLFCVPCCSACRFLFFVSLPLILHRDDAYLLLWSQNKSHFLTEPSTIPAGQAHQLGCLAGNLRERKGGRTMTKCELLSHLRGCPPPASADRCPVQTQAVFF